MQWQQNKRFIILNSNIDFVTSVILLIFSLAVPIQCLNTLTALRSDSISNLRPSNLFAPSDSKFISFNFLFYIHTSHIPSELLRHQDISSMDSLWPDYSVQGRSFVLLVCSRKQQCTEQSTVFSVGLYSDIQFSDIILQ